MNLNTVILLLLVAHNIWCLIFIYFYHLSLHLSCEETVVRNDYTSWRGCEHNKLNLVQEINKKKKKIINTFINWSAIELNGTGERMFTLLLNNHTALYWYFFPSSLPIAKSIHQMMLVACHLYLCDCLRI